MHISSGQEAMEPQGSKVSWVQDKPQIIQQVHPKPSPCSGGGGAQGAAGAASLWCSLPFKEGDRLQTAKTVSGWTRLEMRRDVHSVYSLGYREVCGRWRHRLSSRWRERVDRGILEYQVKATDAHGINTVADASLTDFRALSHGLPHLEAGHVQQCRLKSSLVQRVWRHGWGSHISLWVWWELGRFWIPEGE